MTRRERLERKAAIRRAQDNATTGCEAFALARHHASQADGLAPPLDRSVFSDDEGAIEQLTARAHAREADRDRMRVVNRLYRKTDRAGLAALGLDLDVIAARVAKLDSWQRPQPYAAYQLSNLGHRIRTDRKRIEEITRQHAQRAKADASDTGQLVELLGDQGQWARITFAEKPPRWQLDELKAAGYRWRAPTWFGETDQLPTRYVRPALSEAIAGRSASLADGAAESLTRPVLDGFDVTP